MLPFLGGALFGNRGVRMVEGYYPFPFVAESACQALGEQDVVTVAFLALRNPQVPCVAAIAHGIKHFGQ